MAHAAEEEITASQKMTKDGFLALQNGQVDKGIELLEKAIAEQPDNFVALTTLGQAYSDFKNDYPKAIQLFQQALSIKNDYDFAHFSLGLTYKAMGRDDEARKEFEDTIALTSRPRVKTIAQQALEEMSEEE